MPDSRSTSSLLSKRIAKVLRYGLAVVGPVGSSGAQFVLSLQMLHMLDPKSFGVFSFLLITSTFTCSVWSALFCAPLPIAVSTGTEKRRAEMLTCLFTTSAVGACLVGLSFWPLEASLGVPSEAALLFSVYAAFALLRWFARQHAYLTGNPMRTSLSDLVYGAALVAGVGVIARMRFETINAPFAALLGAAALSLLPFGRIYFRRQILEFSPSRLIDYVDVWRRHSSWALVGVATMEATANAHAYMVTFFMGPLAFAPLSASALLIRPIGVVMTALTDFERPQLAKMVHGGRVGEAVRSLTLFRLALIFSWIGTGLGAFALYRYAPHLIFPATYSTDYLAEAAVLWMAITLMRLLRTPESALLQAAGIFRPLALASVASCGVSVVAVGVLLWLGGPLMSLFGIVVGEATYALWVHIQTRAWRRSAEEGDPHQAIAAIYS